MQLQDVPRVYVNSMFRALRVPLRASEAVLHRGDDERPWPPVIAFTMVEGGLKQAVGSLIRDDQLVHEGKLTQAKARELRQALMLGLVAEAQRNEAEDRYLARRKADEWGKAEADRRAGLAKTSAERRASARKQTLERQAEAMGEEDARLEEATERSLEKRERATRARQVSKERGAVAERRRAVATESAVAEIEEQIEASKQARRSTP